MAVDVKTIVSKLNWAIMPICCVMIGCCYLDRSNVAYMQLQLRRPPPVGMDFSPSLYGNASGLFFLGYALFQVPSNLILVSSNLLSSSACLIASSEEHCCSVQTPTLNCWHEQIQGKQLKENERVKPQLGNTHNHASRKCHATSQPSLLCQVQRCSRKSVLHTVNSKLGAAGRAA